MKTFLHPPIKSHFHIFKLMNSQITKLIKKAGYLIILGVFSSYLTFSQEIEWQNTIGGSVTEVLYSIGKTSDGGCIMGGRSYSNISGDKTENCFGDCDFWIVKTDSLGQVKWENTIGGDSTDWLNSVSQTSDGGYILGGYSISHISADKSEDPLGQSLDYWVVKTDSLGVIQWENTIGGNLEDVLGELMQTPDGGYIVGGYSISNISYDKSEDRVGNTDYWIVKLNSLGNIQWQRTIGGTLSDLFTALDLTPDGGYILGGTSMSGISGNKSDSCFGATDYWVVKLDSLGNIEWDKTYGGALNDNFWTIESTQDGGYIFGGNSRSGIYGNKSENGKGGWDYWVVKTDHVGTIQWQKTLGGSGDDFLNQIKQAPDGCFYIAGYTNSAISGNLVEGTLGSDDICIIKLDSLGREQWENSIGGTSVDQCYAIDILDDGSCLVGGSSISFVNGDKTTVNLGGSDFWIMALTNQYNFIRGLLFADFNSNGVQDLGEPALPNNKLTEQSTGRFVFSQMDGMYYLGIPNPGNYTVNPQLMLWYSAVPGSYTSSFTGNQQIDSLNDFAFQPQGSIEDVCVSISPVSLFRSGFNAYYVISYGNYGTTTIAPTVYFYPDNHLTYQTASIAPTQITMDSVIWSFPPLLPMQTGSILVTVHVDIGLPIGTLIYSTAHIEPYLTDDNPSCNNGNWEVYTVNSLDPNDIVVNRSDFTTTELSASPWLEYIIRFQNTGNDTAFTVKILNPIDTNKLDISSIEFVNASHPVNLNWINYQRNMEFKFENILLPDSTTNELLSHGFVRYRIQPKTNLNAGDSITNSAAIYFDFNDPVITNKAKTIIVLPTGLANTSSSPGKLLVFPNPAESKINISNIHLENDKVILHLTDLYGKLLLEKIITTTSTEISVVNLPSGLYFLQSGEMRTTFVKQ